MLVTRPRHWQYTQATHPSAISRPSIVNGENAMTITDRRLETAKQSSREIVESIGRQRIRRGRSKVNTDVMHWRSSKNKEVSEVTFTNKRVGATRRTWYTFESDSVRNMWFFLWIAYCCVIVFFLWIALRFDLSGVDRNKAPDSQFLSNFEGKLPQVIPCMCRSTARALERYGMICDCVAVFGVPECRKIPGRTSATASRGTAIARLLNIN
ncbi:hypothetical protein T06_15798 [Trichinella sp. T6]|nr:hypothetical protein T06_15798 [Trichinella sp. T6]